MKLPIAAIVVSLLAAAQTLAAQPIVVPVFPNLDPALKSSDTIKDRGTPEVPNRFISNIQYPTLTIYSPEPANTPAPAFVICPGGAYAGVAFDKEGVEVSRWLNSAGIVACILKYRMPHGEPGKPLPLQDVQESFRIVRSHAKDWNIDPKKVGVMGFSAGGHLAATAITHFDAPEDRPDFAVLLYPVITMKTGLTHKGTRKNLLGDSPDDARVDQYSEELHVTADTPPTFLVHAQDDKGVSPQNSQMFFDALQKYHIPSELHFYQTGGHGFGLAPPNTPAAQWPAACIKWLTSINVLHEPSLR